MAEAHAELLERLDAEQQIRRVLTSFTRFLDRMQWDGIPTAFHPDAIDNHGPYHGDVDGLVAWLKRRHTQIETSHHLLGQSFIEFHPPRAYVETPCLVFQRFRQTEGDDFASSLQGNTTLVMTCRYSDVFEERDGDWRIARRHVIFDNKTSIDEAEGSFDPSWLIGRRGDGSDPSEDHLRLTMEGWITDDEPDRGMF